MMQCPRCGMWMGWYGIGVYNIASNYRCGRCGYDTRADATFSSSRTITMSRTITIEPPLPGAIVPGTGEMAPNGDEGAES